MHTKRRFTGGWLFGAFAVLAMTLAVVCATGAATADEPAKTDPYQETTPHITVVPNKNSQDPLTNPGRFVALQVFSGEVTTATDKDAVTNVSWGASTKNKANELISALASSNLGIGKYNESYEKSTDFNASDYKDCKDFGQLFVYWLKNKGSADAKAALGSYEAGTATTEVASSLNNTNVSARDVAAFLQDCAFFGQDAKEAAFQSPSPFTASEVAADFANIVKATVGTEATTEGNAGAGDANKWTSFALKADGGASQLTSKKEGSDGKGWVLDVVDNVNSPTTSKGLPTGYYLVFDTINTGDVAESESVSEYMLRVVGKNDPANTNNVLQIKSNVPTLDKQLKSNTPQGTLGKADSAAVGDKVDFYLTATLPENFESYEKGYKLVFTDKLGSNLKIDPATVKVYVSSSKLESADQCASATEVKTGDAEHGNVTVDTSSGLKVTIPNLQNVFNTNGEPAKIDVTHSSCVYVTYTATVLGTTDASGTTANEALTNTAKLEFSNNPNSGGEGETDTTPDEKTQLYNFGIKVEKVDTKGTAVSGAGFSLLQASGTGSTVTPAGTTVGNAGDADVPEVGTKVAWFTRTGDSVENYVYTFAGWHDPVKADAGYVSWYNQNHSDVTAHMHEGLLVPVVNASNFSDPGEAVQGDTGNYYQVFFTNTSGNASVRGLDEGYFTVIESLTPKGFDVMKPYSWRFDAAETLENATLTIDGQTGGETDDTIADNAGIADLHLVNISGLDLPSTGGAGTIALYVVGGLLVAGGIAYMVIRRRQAPRMEA